MNKRGKLLLSLLISELIIILGGKFLYTAIANNMSTRYNFTLLTLTLITLGLGLYGAWTGSNKKNKYQ